MSQRCSTSKPPTSGRPFIKLKSDSATNILILFHLIEDTKRLATGGYHCNPMSSVDSAITQAFPIAVREVMTLGYDKTGHGSKGVCLRYPSLTADDVPTERLRQTCGSFPMRRFAPPDAYKHRRVCPCEDRALSSRGERRTRRAKMGQSGGRSLGGFAGGGV